MAINRDKLQVLLKPLSKTTHAIGVKGIGLMVLAVLLVQLPHATCDSTATGYGCLVTALDGNGDGKITKTEYMAVFGGISNAEFSWAYGMVAYDADEDGTLAMTEYPQDELHDPPFLALSRVRIALFLGTEFEQITNITDAQGCSLQGCDQQRPFYTCDAGLNIFFTSTGDMGGGWYIGTSLRVSSSGIYYDSSQWAAQPPASGWKWTRDYLVGGTRGLDTSTYGEGLNISVVPPPPSPPAAPAAGPPAGGDSSTTTSTSDGGSSSTGSSSTTSNLESSSSDDGAKINPEIFILIGGVILLLAITVPLMITCYYRNRKKKSPVAQPVTVEVETASAI